MMFLQLRQYRRVVVLLFLACVLGGGVLVVLYGVDGDYREEAMKAPVVPSYEAVSTVRFFEPPGFYEAVKRFPKNQEVAASRGVVVPHHLVADDLIAEILARVANQKVTRIVLIGPNHFELGSAKVTTSRNAWISPVGTVVPDIAAIDELIAQSGYIKNDQSVMDEEHAHASIMPFLAHYFPRVPVVPLAISMKLTREDMDDLVGRLLKKDDGAAFYIATVDFSHYLSESESEKRDQETAALMRAKDVDAILPLTSQYIDSPRSIIVLMEVMDRLGYGTVSIQRNTNTADYLHDYTGEVTSYFGIIFDK